MTAKRLTRKDILKDDPFRDVLQDTMAAILANKNVILIGFLAIVAVVGLYALWQNYSTQAEGEAQFALSKGLDAFHAHVRGPNDPPLTPEQKAMNPISEFKTETEKYTEALKRFQDAAAKYPSRQAGFLAKYYVGLCQQRLGNGDDAIKTLESIRNNFKEPTFDGVAKRTLAELYESKGKYDEAVKLCQELVDNKSVMLPRDQILLLMGRSYEAMNKKDEAIKAYTRIGQEFPTSVYLGDANRNLTKLGAKPVSPPTPPGAPSMGGVPFNLE